MATPIVSPQNALMQPLRNSTAEKNQHSYKRGAANRGRVATRRLPGVLGQTIREKLKFDYKLRKYCLAFWRKALSDGA